MISFGYSRSYVHLILSFSVLLNACSSLSTMKQGEYSSDEMMRFACEVGVGIRSATGRVMAKVSSKEFTGQFQAQVKSDAEDHLSLDVTHPLGGTIALIQVDEGRFHVIDYSGDEPRTQTGRDYWGGIPLKWASGLFLGRIPCPQSKEVLSVEQLGADRLIVKWKDTRLSGTQKFIYQFKEWRRKPWPSALTWTRDSSPNAQVEFEFDSPEASSGSPEKWEVRSSQGQVKVKWRSREISRD